MLTVPPINRDVIDQWPVAESGLPIRVVNSTRVAGIHTVGQLRAWADADLLKLRSLGRISLDNIHFFFRLCAQIEAGLQVFHSIREVLQIFLDETEHMVIAARYGLHADVTKSTRNFSTLQEIGNSSNLTRERVRQIEEAAKLKLSSRLASSCLEPFLASVMRYIDQHGEAISLQQAEPLRDDPLFAAYNPGAVILLLHDVVGRGLNWYRGFFSTLAENTLRDVESRLLEILQQRDAPMPAAELTHALLSTPGPLSLRKPERVIDVILQHHPTVCTTRDGRYFLYERGIQRFLRELLLAMPRPAHYRAITSAFNQAAIPSCRRGSGYILNKLNELPDCKRVDRGVYDLA